MENRVSNKSEKSENELLDQEIKRLTLENKKLSCELKIATGILEKADLTSKLEAS